MSCNLIHRLFKRYFSKGATPFWCVLSLDSIIVFVSGILAFVLNHGLSVYSADWRHTTAPILAATLIFIGCFRVFRTYLGILRFSSFVDLQRLASALLLGMCLCSFIILLLPESIGISVLDITIMTLIALSAMWSLRVLMKRIFDTTANAEASRHNVFIYGVLSGGVALAKSISQPGSKYRLRGFITDDTTLKQHYLMGAPVFRNDADLINRMSQASANILLVSPLKNNDFRHNNTMVNSLIEAGIRIYMMPEATEWDGHSDFTQKLHEVRIEDLLPRDEIKIDLDNIRSMLSGKSILVTGAAGSIGSEIARQVASFAPSDLVLVDQAETPLHTMRLLMSRHHSEVQAHTIVADICNATVMEEIFKRHRPDYVFHAAAYKHVPMMEDNPMESIRNNVHGTKIVADLAVRYGTRKFVMVSTDKAVNPTNVMGCSKRICEIYVQSLDKAIADGTVRGDTRFVTTRFGNVLGSNGSVIPIFQEQIKQGGPVTVTHPDIIRYFMLIPEACRLVLEAGSMGHGGEIFVFDMGKPVKIVDLARRMIKLSGATDIEIKFTGLRDGEKLYEEVLNDREITLPTFHSKIKIAKVREYDYLTISRRIDNLIANTSQADDMLTVAEMKSIVPEFRSQHSKYQVLDK